MNFNHSLLHFLLRNVHIYCYCKNEFPINHYNFEWYVCHFNHNVNLNIHNLLRNKNYIYSLTMIFNKSKFTQILLHGDSFNQVCIFKTPSTTWAYFKAKINE